MRKPFLLYALAAFFLSLWLLKFSYFIGYDGAFYARVGESIFAGKGVSASAGEAYTRKPTFYPFLLGLANLFFKNPEFSGHFVSILAFSLSVIPLFILTRKIYSNQAAHWASLLYITNGFLHLHANTVMTESLFTFLILILLGLLHRNIESERGSVTSGILIGMVSGMASLTRIDGILFYGAGLLAILFLATNPLRIRIRTALASLVLFCLFLLPYLGFIRTSTHRVQLGDALPEILIRRQMDLVNPERYLEAKKFYQGLTDDKTTIRLEKLVKEFNLWDCLLKDRFALLRSIPLSLVSRITELNKYLFGGLGFFFIGASCFAAPWNPRRKKSEWLLLLFLSTFFFQIFSEFIPKRYFFYFPIFLIWMGNGIEVFRNWLKETFRLTPRGSHAAAWGVCLFFAFLSAGYVYRTLSSYPPPLEYKAMGHWMKKNIPRIEEETVVAAHPSVIFYSGARFLKVSYFPYVEKFGDFLTYMAHQKARYFVVSEDSNTPILTHSYRFLLDETQTPPQGILRRHTEMRENRKIILYEIHR